MVLSDCSMSMGFLITESSAVIWRGLMVMQALDKLLRQVHWGSVDYLIIDTPPGTGDTHLSLVQNIPISGVVLVTTPQIAALNVTRRGAVMFQKLKVPIVGIIENMSYIKCPACSNKVHIFGSATQSIAEEFGISIMAHIPLKQKITDSMDKGVPIVISDPLSTEAEAYKNVGNSLIKFVNITANEL
uniref:Iron-sulfur protein NUBPL n=1 Tax=Photinus pyralis TaxID=7054 RepID=A0A1Y1KDQ3_PHOPY